MPIAGPPVNTDTGGQRHPRLRNPARYERCARYREETGRHCHKQGECDRLGSIRRPGKVCRFLRCGYLLLGLGFRPEPDS